MKLWVSLPCCHDRKGLSSCTQDRCCHGEQGILFSVVMLSIFCVSTDLCEPFASKWEVLKRGGAALKSSVKRSAVCVHTLFHFDPGKYCTHRSALRSGQTHVHHRGDSSAARATPLQKSNIPSDAPSGNQHRSEGWMWQRASGAGDTGLTLTCNKSLKMGPSFN